MSNEEFIQKLDRHDWYYEYSDDYKVWCAGRDARAAIIAETKNKDKAQIYRDYIAWRKNGRKPEDKPKVENY